MHPYVQRLALVAGLMLLWPMVALAGPAEEEAVKRLKMLYPQIPIKAIAQTPVEGLFEVIDVQDNIIYFAPKTGHLLSGEMYDRTGQNLTQQRYFQIMSMKYTDIPLDKGLKIGDGPNIVVEVTDPDCPYCRDGAAFWAGRDDVTRYVFFTPLTKIHPEATAKAQFVLSSENPIEAYEDVMAGLYDGKPLPEFKNNGLLEEHVAIGQKLGTRGTPNYWINGKFVSGSNHKKLEQYLVKKK